MRNSLILLAAIIGLIGRAQQPQMLWAKKLPGSATELLNKIAYNNNHVYALGIFNGICDLSFGSNTHTVSIGAESMVVAKFDLAGQLQWSFNIGDSARTWPLNLSFDAVGNIYICGVFTGINDFDPGPGVVKLTTTPYRENYFAMKLDTSGHLIWARKFAECLNASDCHIETTASGESYITAVFNSTTDIDPGPGTHILTGAYRTTFLLKLNSNGNFMWAKTIDGTDSQGSGLAFDAGNTLWLQTAFSGTADLNPGAGSYTVVSGPPSAWGTPSLNATGLVKLDTAGNFIKAIVVGGISSDLTFKGGQFYITGSHLSAEEDFDPGPATYTLPYTSGGSMPFSDLFYLKIDTAAVFHWAYAMGGPSYDWANRIVVDQQNNVYMGGGFSGTLDFDPGPGVVSMSAPTGSYSPFILKLDATGKFVWVETLTNSQSGDVSSLCLDNPGNLYLSGRFTGMATDFAPGNVSYTMSSNGPQDGFIARWGVPATLRLDENKKENNFVYPNPFSETLHIYGDSDGELELTDMSGRLIFSSSVEAGQHQVIHGENLSAGMYLVKIRISKSMTCLKVVKE